jgi:hypothetical protein
VAVLEQKTKLTGGVSKKLDCHDIIKETRKAVKAEAEIDFNEMLGAIGTDECVDMLTNSLLMKFEKKIDAIFEIVNSRINNEIITYAKNLEKAICEEKIYGSKLNTLYKYLNKK